MTDHHTGQEQAPQQEGTPEQGAKPPKIKRPKRFPNVREAERRFEAEFRRDELEKGDVPAMILAALLVFLPAMLIVLALVVGIPFLLFGLGG